MPMPRSFSVRRTSCWTQLLARLPSPVASASATKVVDQRAALVHDHLGVVGVDAIRVLQPPAERGWQFAQAAAHAFDFFGFHDDRHQVGIGKIAVVAGFLLLPLRPSHLRLIVPAPRRLVAAGTAQLSGRSPARRRTAAPPRRPRPARPRESCSCS